MRRTLPPTLCVALCFLMSASSPVKGDLYSGTIKSVSAKKITVETRKGEKSFEFASSVRVKLNGKAAKLESLDAGQRASVITSDAGEVTRIAARSGEKPEETPEPATDTPETAASTPEEALPLETGWTQFRGPGRQNLSGETGLLKQWPREGPKLLWTADELGEGYSSVSTDGTRIYTMGLKGDEEMVHAIDLESGRILWSRQTGTRYTNGQGNGPRGTPTVEGDRVYALGANGDLACLDAESGSIHWQKNILKEFDGRNISWGISESPLIDGEKLICTPGGRGATMVALDKQTGRTIWTAAVPNNPRAGYASPIVIQVGDVKQYVTFTSRGVAGVRAEDGRFQWFDAKAANGTANCSTPLFWNDHVFSASGYGTGCSLVKLTSTRTETRSKNVYSTKDMKNHHGGMVVVDGYIYGTDSRIMTCMDMLSGKIVWKDRSVGKGSVTYADGHIYLRSEGGPVALIEATPEEYREKGRFEPPHDERGRRTWPHPVVAEGRLFLRDMDLLQCYDVREEIAQSFRD